LSKAAPLTSLNVRRKGEAQPAPDAVARGETVEPSPTRLPTPEKVASDDLVPLSFKVPPAFKKRYQLAALQAGMKLNEFLFHLLDGHEAQSRNS
jgi:hypothetical protein